MGMPFCNRSMLKLKSITGKPAVQQVFPIASGQRLMSAEVLSPARNAESFIPILLEK